MLHVLERARCGFVASAAVLALGLAGVSGQAQSDGTILGSETTPMPAFTDLSPASRRVSREDEYERARRDGRFEMVRLTYLSDRLPVVAFVYRPTTSNVRPVVVYNRGSYIRQNAAPELLVTFHRLAEAGFLVVAPMYRGSEGAPGRDELGGADLADLMNIRTVVAALPYADSATVFLYGESRGGMMTLQALRDGFRVRAAAVFGTFTNLERLLREDPRSAEASRAVFPDYEANLTAIAERRSALRWADRISAPLLIMHGGADPQVDPGHSLDLAALLQRHRKPYEVVVVAGAGHTLQPFEADRDERAIRWFRRHLPGTE